ncbi:hypothetical protein [Pseudomonas sp.]|uniref:hypothetical protein n=1 Tax=Pseudomonas sp. TaxID=306 RepID=UPI003FD7B460
MGSTTATDTANGALARAGGGNFVARGAKPEEGSFAEAFYTRVDALIKRGAAVGITVTDICVSSGVARATPDRWREKAPLSITLVDKMEKAVIAAEVAARA